MKKVYALFSLLVVFSMILAACAPSAAEPTEAPSSVTEAPAAATEAPTAAPTEAPVETTDRTGAWVDSIVISEDSSAESAITRIASGEVDLHADTVAEAPAFELLKSNSGLTSSSAVGASNTIMFNPAEFTDGRLNPFSSKKIRESMHWLLNRDYVVEEIYKGLAKPRFTVLTTVFPDYAR